MTQLVICNYCMHPARLCDGREIRDDLTGRPFYKCDPCKAWIAVDPKTGEPRGRLANGFLRKAKYDAYAVVHRIMKIIMQRHGIADKKHAERKAFGILAQQLGMNRTEFQIPWFDIQECESATTIGNAYIEANK